MALDADEARMRDVYAETKRESLRFMKDNPNMLVSPDGGGRPMCRVSECTYQELDSLATFEAEQAMNRALRQHKSST